MHLRAYSAPVLYVQMAIASDTDIYDLDASMELQEMGTVRGRQMFVTTWTTGQRGVSGPATTRRP